MKSTRGFTLVEVLVALFVMAIMAAMAWRGIDGIARARTIGQERMEQTLRLDTVLMQWEQDLAALYNSNGAVPADFTFNGATMLMTRRTGSGVQVVAWSLHNGEWLRWAGPPVTQGQQLLEQWMRVQQLNGDEPQQLHAAKGVSTWQLHCYRNNGWSNCQSSGDVVQPAAPVAEGTRAATARQALPGGVRLIVTFDSGALQGSLTRDVMLGVQP